MNGFNEKLHLSSKKDNTGKEPSNIEMIHFKMKTPSFEKQRQSQSK